MEIVIIVAVVAIAGVFLILRRKNKEVDETSPVEEKKPEPVVEAATEVSQPQVEQPVAVENVIEMNDAKPKKKPARTKTDKPTTKSVKKRRTKSE